MVETLFQDYQKLCEYFEVQHCSLDEFVIAFEEVVENSGIQQEGAEFEVDSEGYDFEPMKFHYLHEDPTFRGMRFSLMNTFDKIYILDLHGNKNQKETTPDGDRDDNVFDIRQGVAIALFVKTSDKASCKVFHADLYGTRDDKYSWLSSSKFADKIYKEIKPTAPWYMLYPSAVSSDKEYLSWPNLKTIFPVNNVGIVTARDKFAIDDNKDSLAVRIRQFRDLRYDENILKEAYSLKDTSTFKLTKFREALSKDKSWNSHFRTITYRPFDNKHIYYSKWVVERPIYDTMRHMLHENLAICFMRQFSGNSIYTHVLLTEHMVDNRTFYSNKGIIQIAPLYLTPLRFVKTSHKRNTLYAIQKIFF